MCVCINVYIYAGVRERPQKGPEGPFPISRVGLGRWVVSANFLGESIRPCVVSAKVYGNSRGGGVLGNFLYT